MRIERTAPARRFRPLGDRVLLKIAAPATKTDGGLFLPSSAQVHDEIAPTVQGEVLAVGPGREINEGPCTSCVNGRCVYAPEGQRARECSVRRVLSRDVKPGDVVLIQATVNLKDEEILVDGETFHLVKAARCMAVVEP